MFVDPARDTDTARLCYCFQPRRDIDGVPEYILRFDNNIANVDPNSEADALIIGDVRIAIDHSVLDLGCTAHSIHHAGKLRQHPVAGVLYGAPAMLLDLWIHQLPNMPSEASVSAFLVHAHQV